MGSGPGKFVQNDVDVEVFLLGFDNPIILVIVSVAKISQLHQDGFLGVLILVLLIDLLSVGSQSLLLYFHMIPLIGGHTLLL